jgi:hypothetical protein
MPAKKTNTKAKTSEPCPICGKELRFVSQHMRTKHGVTMRDYKRGEAPAEAAVMTELNGKGTFRELHDFKVLQDARGNVWLAEKIR